MSSALQCKHSLRFGPSRLHLCTCIIAKVAMNAKLFRRLKTNSDFFPQYASSPTLSTNTLASVCIALICNNTGPSIALNLPSSFHWVEASRSPFLTPTGLKHSARPSSHLLGRSIALTLHCQQSSASEFTYPSRPQASPSSSIIPSQGFSPPPTVSCLRDILGHRYGLTKL